jgi:hypothetical protein
MVTPISMAVSTIMADCIAVGPIAWELLSMLPRQSELPQKLTLLWALTDNLFKLFIFKTEPTFAQHSTALLDFMIRLFLNNTPCIIYGFNFWNMQPE